MSIDASASSRIRERTTLEPARRRRARQRARRARRRARGPRRDPVRGDPGWPVSTAIGHAGVLVLGTLDRRADRASCAGGRTCTRGSGRPASRSACGFSAGSESARSSSRTPRAGSIPDSRPGPLVAHLRSRQPAGHVAARRPERRLARAALPGHERRLRPELRARRARGCGAARASSSAEGVYARVARAAVRDAGRDPVHARRRWRSRRDVDRAGGASRRGTWASASSGSRS